jgi:ABC-type lipoprotein release transport system permease subunit
MNRKRQRALVTILALGLAGAMQVFFSCLVNGFQDTMIHAMIDQELGHLQAHAPGWRQDPDLYNVLPDEARSLRAFEELGWKASPRLYAFALAAWQDQSSGVELRGLDPAKEKEVSILDQRLARGNWLDAKDPKGVVLGRELAKRLKAEPGDEIVLLTQAADGSMSDGLYKVRGVLKSVSAKADEAGLYMNEAAFRDLMVMPTGVHEIALRLPELPKDLKAAEAIGSKALPGAEVLSWRGLNPMAANILDVQKVGILIFMALAYLAVGMVIFNAMLMNVFDRMREFGVMRALGTAPSQILRLVYAEALLESLIAAAFALLLGLAVSYRVQSHGLDLSSLSGGSRVAGMVLEPVMHAKVEAGAVAVPIIFLFVLSAIAVAWPASKAALVRPVEAMRGR